MEMVRDAMGVFPESTDSVTACARVVSRMTRGSERATRGCDAVARAGG